MKKILRQKLNHALSAFLLTAGLLIPLLGILDVSFAQPQLLLWAAAVIVLFEAFSFNRITAVIGASLCLIGVMLWLFALNGLSVMNDVLIALSLRLSGQTAALPLIRDPVLWIMTVLIPLVSCFAVMDQATWLPSLCLTIIAALLIWLSNRMDLLPWILPAIAAVLLRLILDRYEELDPFRLLPWIAAIVTAAFFLIPGNSGELAPMKEKADELRQAIMDRLFFTEARDVFSLAAEGYYPQGMNQLGGKPDISDHPVMQVSAPRTVYLRGVLYNNYNGRSWSNTTGGRRYLWQALSQRENRESIFNENLPPETARGSLCDPLTISVRMLSDSASTLFVPQRIRELIPGGDLVPYFSNASEVFVTRNLNAGATWTVQAPLFVAGDSGLNRIIEASASFDDPAYEAIASTYTVLPSHLEQPVYDLASEIASAGLTPYDKAMAIQSWLSRSFRYTLDVQPQPENEDFVTFFLMTSKEGYCTYFASAMTVLSRMAGLPARYVEGYLAEPDENGRATVTGRSGHAWTEIYFKGFGWLTFDATPRHGGNSGQEAAPPSAVPDATPSPSEEPSPDPEPTEPEPSPAPEDEPTPSALPPEATPTPDPVIPPTEPPSSTSDEVPPSEPDPGPRFPFRWLLWLIPFLLVLLLIVWRIRKTSPSVRDRHAASERERFEIWVQELSELLRSEGLIRSPGETPMRFARRVDRSPRFSVSILPCGECLSLIHYSRVQPLKSDTDLLRSTAGTVKKELTAPARMRYWLRRFFLPLRRRDYGRIS